jgi:hypothetical protein
MQVVTLRRPFAFLERLFYYATDCAFRFIYCAGGCSDLGGGSGT